MTSKKPVILLTPYFNTERDEPYMRPAFLKAVRHAGAVPVILPWIWRKKIWRFC